MIETSLVFEKIKKLLEENNVNYQLFEHEPVFTSEQAAAIRNTPKRFGAKAMIFAADSKPLLIVVPGDKRVDTKTFKKLFKIKDLRLLSGDEVKELTGLEIGAIPPFGSTMNLPTYLDEEITQNEGIVFNVGAHTKSIKMKPTDFLKLEKPVVGNFS
jgi:Cys-tRNA(Pro) deacylase